MLWQGKGMNFPWLLFWVAALATYRLTVLVARDLGPWGLCQKLRRRWKVFACPYCISMYAGSVVCFGLYFSGLREPWQVWILLSLSFSAIAIILDRSFSFDV